MFSSQSSLGAMFHTIKFQCYNVIYCLFEDNIITDIFKLQLYKEFIDERLRKKVNNQHLGSIKRDKIKRHEKQQCKGSLCHPRQVTSTRETIAVPKSVTCSIINLKGIVSSYECSSVVRTYFDDSVLLSYGDDQKLDLVHLVSSCIEDA